MNDSILEMLEESADELLSKAKKSDELDPEEISEDAETEEEEEADGGDDEEVADDADEEVEDDDEDEEDSDSVKKSLVSAALEDEEVSEQMAALVEIFAKSLADVLDTSEEMHAYNQTSTDTLAKSMLAQNVILGEQARCLTETQAALAEIRESIGALEAKMDDISVQPAHIRKSVQAVNVTERNFTGSLQGTQAEPQPLSKSEVLGILNNELASGSPIVTADDIVNAESGAPLRSEIRALLASKRTR